MTSRKLFDSTSEVTVTEAYDCAILSSCGRKKLVICDSVLLMGYWGTLVPHSQATRLVGGVQSVNVWAPPAPHHVENRS